MHLLSKLCAGLLTLVAPSGEILDSLQSVDVLQDGDSLCAIAQRETSLQIASTERSFAAWCCGNDRVVTWGDPQFGGDTTSVQVKLKNVQQVHATKDGAFAAILAEGRVVTWGSPRFGGDSSLVQDKLKDVQCPSIYIICFCSYSGKWSSCDMGQFTAWW